MTNSTSLSFLYYLYKEFKTMNFGHVLGVRLEHGENLLCILSDWSHYIGIRTKDCRVFKFTKHCDAIINTEQFRNHIRQVSIVFSNLICEMRVEQELAPKLLIAIGEYGRGTLEHVNEWGTSNHTSITQFWYTMTIVESIVIFKYIGHSHVVGNEQIEYYNYYIIDLFEYKKQRSMNILLDNGKKLLVDRNQMNCLDYDYLLTYNTL